MSVEILRGIFGIMLYVLCVACAKVVTNYFFLHKGSSTSILFSSDKVRVNQTFWSILTVSSHCDLRIKSQNMVKSV